MFPHTVFVSGATGFIASHTITRLLAAGHRVRGSVRSVKKASDVAFLRDRPGADRLELVEADLLAPNAFAGLLDGCDVVLHMASPYVLDVANPQRDLIDPAVHGTRSMLEACATTSGLRRVVLTSSMAAITDEPDARHVLTENDWNTSSTLTRNPYYLSKTLAEREAWTFKERRTTPWDLVVVNPFMVMGPSLTSSLNTSNKVIADLLNGGFPAIVSVTWGVVDVRDVADAHIRAMDAPGASGRYICAAGTASMREFVEILGANGYGRFRLPTRGLDHPIGNLLVRLASRLQSRGTGQYLRSHVGRVPRFDNAKIRRDLGMQFRPVEQTLLETAADLVRWGHATPPTA